MRESAPPPPMERFRALLQASKAPVSPTAKVTRPHWLARIESLSEVLFQSLFQTPNLGLGRAYVAPAGAIQRPEPIARVASLVLNDPTKPGVLLELYSRPAIDATGALALGLCVPAGMVESTKCTVILVLRSNRELLAVKENVPLDIETSVRFNLPQKLADQWRPLLSAAPPPPPTDYPFGFLIDAS